MFEFSSPLFWYKIVFVIELMIAEGLATYSFKKRKNFAVRVVSSVLSMIVIAFLLPLFFVSPIINVVNASAMFFILFVASTLFLKLCYDEKFVSLFFCAVVAFTTQHIAYSAYTFITDISGIETIHVYGESVDNKSFDIFAMLIYFGVYGIFYWFVWAFIEHKIREQEKLKTDFIMIFGFTGILFVNVVLNMIEVYVLADTRTDAIKTVLYLYQLVSVILIYTVLYSTMRRQLAEEETLAVESLWEQDRKSFELSRQNIEQINIKCHDLKHQIRKLKNKEKVDDAFIKELEESVTIYNNSIKTGNAALDLIIAENSLAFSQNKIRLSAIADGACLSFMSDADIYSLFGNALHNAAEALCKTGGNEQRLIKLQVKRIGRMASIHSENYCTGVVIGANELPKTDKRESGHGYGLRSMQLIAEKYGGFLTVEIVESMFNLDIMIPIPD